MAESYQCISCKHYDAFFKCKAFGRNKIPMEILSGEHDHTLPFPGDNGIRYEPIKEATKAAVK